MGTIKWIALAAMLCIGAYSYAGHEEGGIIITYKSLEHVNGDSLEYELTVYSIYSLIGPSAPTTASVNLSSSCFTNSIYSLPRISNSSGGLLSLANADYCVGNTTISSNSGLALYRDTVILPGYCADFRFYISGGFGRYSFATNLASNFNTAYFFTDLNNLHGLNSTPDAVVNDLIQAICINKPLSLYGFTEPDGDSIVFTASTPQTITGSTTSNYSYNAGYSVNNPVGSTSGYTVDTTTGAVNTEVPGIGTYIITIKFREFRTDTATQSPVMVSRGRFIMTLIASGNCVPASFDLRHQPGANTDSIGCGASWVNIATTRKIASASLTPNGSEFSVSSDLQGAVGISSIALLNDSLIRLNLSQTIGSNDTLRVMAQMGTDSNVVISRCGRELAAYADTLVFYSTPTSAPQASFTYSSNFLNATFNGGSSVGDSLIWDFGDGSPPSGMPSPNHTYGAKGMYTVQLISFNICGETDTATQTIQICDSIVAAMNYSQSGDTLFVDAGTSTGATAYYWDFGDGGNGTGLTTQHVYSSSGFFDVTLTVVNACGDSSSIIINIENCILPTAWWTYNIVSSGGSGMIVDFDGSSSTSATSWIWDFGDGNINTTSLTPTHTYTIPSLTYQVSLTITNNCGDQANKTYRLNEIGLDENEVGPKFEVYPNPVVSDFIIKWEQNSDDLDKVMIYSTSGVLVKAISLSSEQAEKGYVEIHKSNLSAGLYSLQMYFASGKSAQYKIIVQ